MLDSDYLEPLGGDVNIDLKNLLENNIDEEHEVSPFDICKNSCKYYDPSNVKVNFSDLDELSMFCINTQGLRAHWDAFYNLLQEIGNEASNFDIVAITEIFGMTKNEYSLPG